MTPDSKTEMPQRVPPLAPGSVIYALFEHMEAEHGLTLLGSELTEIISIVNASLEARLEWWMRNAEGIALERADLINTLREIRDPRPSMEWQAKIIDAAIAVVEATNTTLSPMVVLYEPAVNVGSQDGSGRKGLTYCFLIRSHPVHCLTIPIYALSLPYL